MQFLTINQFVAPYVHVLSSPIPPTLSVLTPSITTLASLPSPPATQLAFSWLANSSFKYTDIIVICQTMCTQSRSPASWRQCQNPWWDLRPDETIPRVFSPCRILSITFMVPSSSPAYLDEPLLNLPTAFSTLTPVLYHPCILKDPNFIHCIMKSMGSITKLKRNIGIERDLFYLGCAGALVWEWCAPWRWGRRIYSTCVWCRGNSGWPRYDGMQQTGAERYNAGRLFPTIMIDRISDRLHYGLPRPNQSLLAESRLS